MVLGPAAIAGPPRAYLGGSRSAPDHPDCEEPATCDYCGCRSRALLAELGEDHARLALQCRRLLASIASGNLDEAAEQVVALAELLRPHSALEEEGLYQELRSAGIDTQGLFEDHAQVDAAVAAAVRNERGAWSALPAALVALEAHIDREEYDLFTAAHQLLDDAAWDRLDAALRDRPRR